MIHNLANLEGSSVNNGIPTYFAVVQYATIQDGISFVKNTKPIVFMANVDIEAAFRIIVVVPNDTTLLSFQRRDMSYIDGFLPMGCYRSCAIFVTFSTTLEWIEMIHS